MILERYIVRNYIGPFIFSVSVITFVFIMDFILKYIDLFLSKGVAFHIVLQTFVLSLGHMFALIIPMAVLPATLMTFGNFASENEITAMRASGISIYRMILPGALGALVLSILLLFYNNYVLPESNHKLMNLLVDIGRQKPTVELQERRFIDDLQGYTIYFEEKNDKTGEIRDVQIFKRQAKGQLPSTIVAKSGYLKYLPGQNMLRVDLSHGELHEMPVARDRGTYRRTRFNAYTVHIRDVDRSFQRSERSHRGDREMSVDMMRDKIGELKMRIEESRIKMIESATRRVDNTFELLNADYRHQRFGVTDSTVAAAERAVASATGSEPPNNVPRVRVSGGSPGTSMPAQAKNEYITRQELETQINKRESYIKQIDRYRVEIHKKYSIPFACVIFALVGSPLAIRMGRSGMNMAIGLSILFFLVYYVCLIGGEKVADRGLVSPIIAMWSPNIIFGVMAAVLLREAAREQSLKDWTFWGVLKSWFTRRHASANPR